MCQAHIFGCFNSDEKRFGSGIRYNFDMAYCAFCFALEYFNLDARSRRALVPLRHSASHHSAVLCRRFPGIVLLFLLLRPALGFKMTLFLAIIAWFSFRRTFANIMPVSTSTARRSFIFVVIGA